MTLQVTKRAAALMQEHGIVLAEVLSKAATKLSTLSVDAEWTLPEDATPTKLDVICALRGGKERDYTTIVEFHVCDVNPPRLDPANAPVDAEQLYVQTHEGGIIVSTPDDDQDDGIVQLAGAGEQ